MATPSAASSNPSRDAKLNKFFDNIIRGVQSLKTTTNAHLFIEALCAHSDPPACINKLVSSPAGLSALQTALRFNDSASFHNGPATALLKYLQQPALKMIFEGSHLHRVILSVVEPSLFWDPFLSSFRNGLLDAGAQECFGWLLSELLCLPDGAGAGYLTVAKDPSIETRFQNSESSVVRSIGQKIKHIVSVFDSSQGEDGLSGPGGRHDNDYANFREIAIHPTAGELSCGEPAFMRMALEIDDSSDESKRLALHLDNQFRLLREDMLIEMREELLIISGKKKGRHRGLIVNGLKLVDIEIGNHEERKPLPWGLVFQCTEDFRQLAGMKPQERRDYFSAKANRNTFKHQSLACLIVDNEIVSFPIIYRDLDQLAQKPPMFTLQFTGDASTAKSLLKAKTAKQMRLVQIDTAVFAFEPVLKGLQELRDMPLADELLFWNSESIMSRPLHAPSGLIDRLEAKPTQDLRHTYGLDRSVVLDSSQMLSLLTGLKQRVSLIQGPPGKHFLRMYDYLAVFDKLVGTGKSFIGALIAKSIFQFTKMVILVVCFKNHALDQFLEDLLDIGIPSEDMVRLGGQSTERTKCMQLRDQPADRSNVPYTSLDELRKKTNELGSEMRSAFGTYYSTKLQQADLMDYLEFLPDDGNYFEAFSVPEVDDGFSRVDEAGKAVGEWYLLDRWSQDKNAGVFCDEVYENFQTVWSMLPSARQDLLSKWKCDILGEQVSRLQALGARYNRSLSELERMRKWKDKQVIGSKRIIACTTT